MHNTISDLGGVTGQAIIRAILAGERDPVRLAALRDRRIQASPEELWHSLRGNWKEEALFELQQAVEAYDFYGRPIAECDRRLQQYLAALPSRESVPQAPAAEVPTSRGQAGKPEVPRKVVKRKGNEPPFDIESQQRRILGVDAPTIEASTG